MPTNVTPIPPPPPSHSRTPRFRAKASQAFQEIYQRATTQRFYVLSRQRGGTPECPEETVQITGNDNNRKPLEGDCPICFEEMEAQGEAIVWCKAACGQNIHQQCFEMWAATKRQQAGAGDGDKVDVTCPYCRSVWEGDEDMVKKIEKTGPLNAEGYVNVAEQLGISNERGERDLRSIIR